MGKAGEKEINEAIPSLYKTSRAYDLLNLRYKTDRCVEAVWH